MKYIPNKQRRVPEVVPKFWRPKLAHHDLVRAANADAAAWLEQQGLMATYTGKA